MIEQPVLNQRARGWLRFIWDKATVEDDWSSEGEPHAWWDKTTTAPMCAFPRFDLSETSYALPLLVDQTPAWREVYTRIADELVGRYTTFWAAIDWLTLIGPDPNQNNYPPEWQVFMPEHLRGRYDPPGWTGNGNKPWGLQPDPIAADGNLFFRGFFNLLLSTYSYVSGDDKWERPFKMTGYQNRLYEWTQHSITQFIEDQWSERPQGAHCENTKVWPYCLSAAGLGLQLYDKVFDGSSHWVYDRWVEYAKKHFVKRNGRGDIESFAFYYDPIEQIPYTMPEKLAGYGTLAPLFYLYPQAQEFGRELYESGVSQLGWNKQKGNFVQVIDDPRWLSLVLMLARELGDLTTERRLSAVAEQQYGENFFGDDPDRFAWQFGVPEPYPRGQLNGLMILSEIGDRGAWTNVYREQALPQYKLPTVVGIDYPRLGISRAVNIEDSEQLFVSTYAADSSRRGADTSWQIEQLPNANAVEVFLGEERYNDWRVVNETTVEIQSTIDEHHFKIRWANANSAETRSGKTTKVDASATNISAGGSVSAPSSYRPAAPPSCACC